MQPKKSLRAFSLPCGHRRVAKRRPHGPGELEIERPHVSGKWLPFSFEATEDFRQRIPDLYLTAPFNNTIAREVSCRGMKIRLFRMIYQDINRVVLQAVYRMSRCCRRADHLEFLEPWRTKLKIIQIDVEISSTIPTLWITRGCLVIQPKKTHPRCVRN